MNPYISIEKESKLMNISLETNEKQIARSSKGIRKNLLRDRSNLQNWDRKELKSEKGVLENC